LTLVVAYSPQHKETDYNNASTPFEFTPENWELVKATIAKYPPQYKMSALCPVLDIAQRQCGGWLPLAAMNKVRF
jgi:NADH:ubiquinone oxidoreductase subunit E